MLFHEHIVIELRTNAQDDVHEEALRVLSELQTAFDEGGADAVTNLFVEMQSGIRTDFEAALGKLKNAM